MRKFKLGVATVSLATAIALSFTSLFISDDHDIAANVLFVVAQFLTLCATILGIDYKFFSPYANNSAGNPQQQPA